MAGGGSDSGYRRLEDGSRLKALKDCDEGHFAIIPLGINLGITGPPRVFGFGAKYNF